MGRSSIAQNSQNRPITVSGAVGQALLPQPTSNRFIQVSNLPAMQRPVNSTRQQLQEQKSQQIRRELEEDQRRWISEREQRQQVENQKNLKLQNELHNVLQTASPQVVPTNVKRANNDRSNCFDASAQCEQFGNSFRSGVQECQIIGDDTSKTDSGVILIDEPRQPADQFEPVKHVNTYLLAGGFSHVTSDDEDELCDDVVGNSVTGPSSKRPLSPEGLAYDSKVARATNKMQRSMSMGQDGSGDVMASQADSLCRPVINESGLMVVGRKIVETIKNIFPGNKSNTPMTLQVPDALTSVSPLSSQALCTPRAGWTNYQQSMSAMLTPSSQQNIYAKFNLQSRAPGAVVQSGVPLCVGGGPTRLPVGALVRSPPIVRSPGALLRRCKVTQIGPSPVHSKHSALVPGQFYEVSYPDGHTVEGLWDGKLFTVRKAGPGCNQHPAKSYGMVLTLFHVLALLSIHMSYDELLTTYTCYVCT